MRDRQHCPQCNAPRSGSACWKCGTDTIRPDDGWEYPELPPVERIRELAREVGYAIGEHGSKERDLDLIAVPWTEDAVSITDLLNHITSGLRATVIGDGCGKPHGRHAVSIRMDGWYKIIDLSITPRLDT